MNYYNIYSDLIATRKLLNRKSNNDGKLENHHILPKSLGGTNHKDNLVYLTPKEHFIAHLLLTKMYTSKNKSKMVYAFSKMCQCNSNQQRKINSRYYALSKTLMSLHCSGKNGSFYGKTHSQENKKKFSEQKIGENNPMFGKDPWNKGLKLPPISDYQRSIVSKTHKGKIISDDTKIKMSLSAIGKSKTEEHKKKLSDANLGKITSQETRDKLSAIHKGKLQKPHTCPYCNKEGRGSSMLRWHFNNCKSK